MRYYTLPSTELLLVDVFDLRSDDAGYTALAQLF